MEKKVPKNYPTLQKEEKENIYQMGLGHGNTLKMMVD